MTFYLTLEILELLQNLPRNELIGYIPAACITLLYVTWAVRFSYKEIEKIQKELNIKEKNT